MKEVKKYGIVVWVLLTLVTMAGCGKSYEVTDVEVIPEPVTVAKKVRSFTFSNSTRLYYSNLGQNSQTAKYITKSLRQMHFKPRVVGHPKGNTLVLELLNERDSTIGDEGYRMEIKPSGITISANSERGLFYGYQTLLQMFPTDATQVRYSKVTLPECSIVDYPQYEWRGCHLDVSRHFFGVKSIKRLLDLMAMYKMNKFHWHLTDDHGWRLESERMPKLNSVGSWRPDRSGVVWSDIEPASDEEECTYGGYYTKAEVAEIVEYAAQRHIDVVPEIELPGHASAILAAYPELACDEGKDFRVQVGTYYPSTAVLCLGKEEVMNAVKGLLDEVIGMFPYEYIHIGGNEVAYDEWEECPRCQARMRALKLKDEQKLHQWMVSEMSKYLAEHGRHLIGWDEIAEGNLEDGDVVMSWRGTQGGAMAAKIGHRAIMAPEDYCSFDYYQADPKYQPISIGPPLTLDRVYSFNPMPTGLTAAQSQLVWGGECMLWSEYINDWDYAEYMLMPRLCAMAEDLWTPCERKDFIWFRHKIVSQKLRLSALGFKYCEGSFKPIVKTSHEHGGKCIVTIDTEVEGAFVYYTLDGTMPTLESPTYTAPLELESGTQLRLRVMYEGLPKEGTYDYNIK